MSTHTPGTEVRPPEVTLRTVTLVGWGILAWVVALAVLLLVPSLRSGDRSWWVWVPVAGIALGAVGYGYLRRGKGNASEA
ncbi:DUF2530 domain-containing protein [Ornithinimicrobium sufpigmenti]|uniref:DUF2530 domain-containing protein n=1 Tax=Ornithinimicrobium sufpigmenti TaxID=2508882 RepID=UPI0010368962|nr:MULTISPECIES: DUF2530 domain-containing protein [unclassified Ornithinimicrobium]